MVTKKVTRNEKKGFQRVTKEWPKKKTSDPPPFASPYLGNVEVLSHAKL